MSDFLKRLKDAVENFDMATATALSDELHEAEDSGYVISHEEDKLWTKLTQKIIEKSKAEKDQYNNMA